MSETPDPAPPQLDAEALKARKRRNLWLGLALAGFVILVMITTVIRLHTGTGVSERM
ncbi:MAG: hypothetical protein Q8S09_06045 [Hyphomonas sp.]|jgi:hypothetical protein|nr:hypothetical protein [Hyphomonas sp.]MDP3458820.1 hypothetical protein [Hyphomonas sp.]